uniref:Uncharacterized protein n=1 Tax=Octopus bimaculoides TaxID=37653 RepID=A0A0L8FLR4_OCTBM
MLGTQITPIKYIRRLNLSRNVNLLHFICLSLHFFFSHMPFIFTVWVVTNSCLVLYIRRREEYKLEYMKLCEITFNQQAISFTARRFSLSVLLPLLKQSNAFQFIQFQN